MGGGKPGGWGSGGTLRGRKAAGRGAQAGEGPAVWSRVEEGKQQELQ